MHFATRLVAAARRPPFLYGLVIVSSLAMAMPAGAVEQTFFFQGMVDSPAFLAAPGSPGTIPDPLPSGTPVTGWYTIDDAAVDSDGDADIGTYPTGKFFVDFGAAGSILFDISGTTTVRNDAPCCFPGFVQDSFSIRTTGGTPSLSFSNSVNFPQSSLSFGDGLPFGAPNALGGDDLNAVPHVVGEPWEDNGISIQFANDGEAVCSGVFISHCTVGIAITQITTDQPVPALPPIGLLVLAILLVVGALWMVRSRLGRARA